MMLTDFKNEIMKSVFREKGQEEQSSVDWIFDFRRVSLKSEFLEIFVKVFFEKIKSELPNLKKFQVCGLESASLPFLSAIVLSANKYNLEVSGFFIRKGRKKSDLHKVIEGVPNEDPVIIFDDILNSGKSFFQQIAILENESLKIKAVFSVIRFRNSNFYDFIANRKINLINLFELNDFKKELNLKNIENDENQLNKPLNYKILWKTKKAEKAFLREVLQKSHILIDENKIYYATDDGMFFCAKKETGETIWHKKILFGSSKKLIFSSPTIFGEKLFFGAYDGNFYCLNKNTGEEIWKNMDADWIGSSPAISKKYNLVFIGMEYGLWKKHGGVSALDTETGRLIWKDTHESFTHCSPFSNQKEDLLFCGSNDGKLRIYNPKSGQKLKEIACEKEIKMSFSENQYFNKVAFGDFSGKTYIVDQKSFEVTDQFKTDEAIYSTPIWVDDFIVVTSLDKKMYKYDTKNKKIVWTFQTNGRIFFDPNYKDKYIWTGSNDGRLYKVNFETGKSEGYLQFSERVINNLIFEDNKIYLNTFLNEVYCIEIDEDAN